MELAGIIYESYKLPSRYMFTVILLLSEINLVSIKYCESLPILIYDPVKLLFFKIIFSLRLISLFVIPVLFIKLLPVKTILFPDKLIAPVVIPFLIKFEFFIVPLFPNQLIR